jgi:hypothetical protein
MRPNAYGCQSLKNIRGIVHCHTNLSYDCQVTLPELSDQLRREGFHFVALTEHTQGVTRETYSEFLANCRKETRDDFVVLPGLEFRCEEGIEIAGLGLWEFMEGALVADVVARVRNQGGYAIWVHPKKRGEADRMLDCDAVEVLNGKVDGVVAPDLSMVRMVRESSEGQRRRHMIFGLDFHSFEQGRHVWTECAVSRLDARSVLESLREGRFWNCVAHGRISSSGEMTFSTRARLQALRWAYLRWNGARETAPPPIQRALSLLGEPIVKLIKRI